MAKMAILTDEGVVGYFPCKVFYKRRNGNFRLYVGKAGGVADFKSVELASFAIDQIIDAFDAGYESINVSEFPGVISQIR